MNYDGIGQLKEELGPHSEEFKRSSQVWITVAQVSIYQLVHCCCQSYVLSSHVPFLAIQDNLAPLRVCSPLPRGPVVLGDPSLATM